MFWRYQRHDRDVWFPINARSEDEAFAKAREANAVKLTILSSNVLITDDTSESGLEAVRYKGPLYFDLDLKNELETVIDSALSLAKKLIEMGVEQKDIRIFLSGSKGLHLMVPAQVFCSGSAYRNLPAIYKEMAKELYVPGLDFAVYSAGKGNSWRIANVKRSDGNYRVPISYEELKDLNEEGYRALVKSPREGEFFNLEPSGKQSPELAAMFEDCRKRVGEKPRKISVVTDESLTKIAEQVPTCVNALCAAKGWKAETNYNMAAMNLAAYIARTNADKNKADSLVGLLANNASSAKYSTVRERLNHAKGQVAYARSSPKLSFSCNAMRSLLSMRPCEGCPIEARGSSGEQDDMQAIAKDEGYYVLLQTGALRRLTNFVLEPLEVFNEIQPDGTVTRRSGLKVRISKSGDYVGTIVMSEEAFDSRGNFVRELRGIAGLGFEGSDSDVQKIKQNVDRLAEEANETMMTYTCGVHIDSVGDTEVATYVEPSGSINSLRIRDTHKFKGVLLAPPYLFNCESAKKGDEQLDHALFCLLNSTLPHYAALIAGWNVACHSKAHIMHHVKQFPILSLWGNAGSGKSVTAALFTWLNGTDFHGEDSSVHVPSITDYALREFCSTTTTIPRILEEFNKSKIRKPGLYEMVVETIKSAWEGSATLRGALGGNSKANQGRISAKIVSIPMSAPLIVVSEQELEVPAVRDRTLRVHLTEKSKAGRENFHREALKHRAKIRQFAKSLMIRCLQTKSADVYKRVTEMEELLPKGLRDRPKWSLQVALFGISEFISLAEELELPKSVKRAKECKEALVTALQSAPVQASNPKSEVDEVMTDIGTMMAVSHRVVQDSQPGKSQAFVLVEGLDYVCTPPLLFIDPIFVHLKYIQFLTTYRRTPVIDRADQFLKLIREETYFVEERRHEGFFSDREVICLSLQKMAEKGIDPKLFQPLKLPEGFQ